MRTIAMTSTPCKQKYIQIRWRPRDNKEADEYSGCLGQSVIHRDLGGGEVGGAGMATKTT